MPEAFTEVANQCCGAINQALTVPFPDLGMSTPYLLSGSSIDYLPALAPDHVAAYDLTLDGDVRVGATLCVRERAGRFPCAGDGHGGYRRRAELF